MRDDMAKVILDTDTGEMTDMLDETPMISMMQDPEQFFGVWQNYAYNMMIQKAFESCLSTWMSMFK